MKTTVDIPDSLLQQAKARAALKGTSMRDFFLLAIAEKLDTEQRRPGKLQGWRKVFGKAPRGSTEAVRAAVDSEFERVNPDEWQ
jgi:hypothetical protein